MSRNRRKVAALLVPFACVVACGSASAQGMPSVGSVQIPPVSPEQAQQLFATRVVPPSSVPAVTSAAAPAQPLQSVNVEPVLGHDLPTDASVGGFSRADFAIAKPDDARKKSAAVSNAVVGRSAPATTVIQEQPPVIGRP
jgi:hypothetical protein